jgi:hypothetical protein
MGGKKNKSRSQRNKKNSSTASSQVESSVATDNATATSAAVEAAALTSDAGASASAAALTSDVGASTASATSATNIASAGEQGGQLLVGQATWDDALPRATMENVLELPLANHHIWKCGLYESANAASVLRITDITYRNSDIVMGFGPYPDPVSAPEDFVKPLLATLLAPMPAPVSAGEKQREMHKPRRPRFLLLDKTIEETYAHIKEALEAVGVPVRLDSETAYCEATVAAYEPPLDPLKCSWADALHRDRDRFRPTVSRVQELPQYENQVWKCFPYEAEDSAKVLFVMKDITTSPGRPVGVGPISLLSMPEAILGVMLAPKFIDEDSPALTEDEPRRPGRLVLHEVINEGANYIRFALMGSGVQIVSSKLHDEQVLAAAPASECALCEKSSNSLQSCARCQKVAYCNRDCQVAHWNEHKKDCNP